MDKRSLKVTYVIFPTGIHIKVTYAIFLAGIYAIFFHYLHLQTLLIFMMTQINSIAQTVKKGQSKNNAPTA